MGWLSRYSDPVAHGRSYLFSTMRRADGMFHTAFDTRTKQPAPGFSLYEHAFYLLALAHVNERLGERRAADAALACLSEMRRQCGKSNGGFEDSIPHQLPLKSNPHMHLLEAALAWIEKGSDAQIAPWVALANELVGLALRYFIARDSGAIREYFDDEWRPVAGEPGRIVEPGHQFEWAWLLMRWAKSAHCGPADNEACMKAAARLIEVGERWGVDGNRGLVINELWDDMSVKDSAAKIWPQTERLKAWCAVLGNACDEAQVMRARLKIAASIRGLQSYFVATPQGAWREVSLADGSFVDEPSKASSLYHIVCAIDTVQRTLRVPAQGMEKRLGMTC